MNIDVKSQKKKCTLFYAFIYYILMYEAITILIWNVNSLGEMEWIPIRANEILAMFNLGFTKPLSLLLCFTADTSFSGQLISHF